MKKIKQLAFYLLSGSLLSASVSTTVTAENILDASSNTVNSGMLALLVVSTSDSNFGPVVEGGIGINNTVSDAGFLDRGDDAIIKHFETSINGFTSISEAASASVIVNLDARFSAGDSFAIYWFPTIAYNIDITQITLSAGDSYGLVLSGRVQDDGTGIDGVKDWILPADGNSAVYSNENAGEALLEVQPIPEPASLSLLGLGALGLMVRRCRV